MYKISKQRRKKDKLLRRIVLLVLCVASVYVTTMLLVDNQIDNPSGKEVTSISILPPESQPGFAVYFSDKYKVGLLFPKDQDPLKADKEINTALESVTTKDFTIRIHDSPGFRYTPWLTPPPECVYDGALKLFSGSIGCDLQKTTINEVAFHPGSFKRDTTTKHTFLTPIKSGKYFLEMFVIYEDDCMTTDGRADNVCEFRSAQRQIKLTNFVQAVVEKNHELFGP